MQQLKFNLYFVFLQRSKQQTAWAKSVVSEVDFEFECRFLIKFVLKGERPLVSIYGCGLFIYSDDLVDLNLNVITQEQVMYY